MSSVDAFDLARHTNEEAAQHFTRVHRQADNYCNVKLNHARACICVSRAQAFVDCTWRDYLGISAVEVAPSHRGKGEFRKLVLRLFAIAILMKRTLCITEVYGERLLEIMSKGPWRPYAWFCGDPTKAPVDFAMIG